MTATYKLKQKAKDDLKEIYKYGFFRYGEKQADKYYQDLFERFEIIARTPFLYPAVDHIYEGYRRSVYGAHSIYYRLENDTVEITRILKRQSI